MQSNDDYQKLTNKIYWVKGNAYQRIEGNRKSKTQIAQKDLTIKLEFIIIRKDEHKDINDHY